jgi:hypothetical protein
LAPTAIQMPVLGRSREFTRAGDRFHLRAIGSRMIADG